jgi:DNA repair protein RadD
VSAGDFQRGAAARAMEKPAIVGDIVATWRKLAAGRATIGFAADIAHSEKMVAAFRDAGISAAHVDGTTPRAERARLLEDLSSGALTVLWNAQLLTLGIDVPRVSCIIMARPTLSETVYLQEGGRGLRPSPGKSDLLLLDHAGNCLRHGLLEWPRTWSLEGVVRRKKDETVPGLRLPCRKCFAISPAGATACVACWEPFPKKPRVVLHRPGELKEATFAEKAAAFAPEAREKALAKWIREGHERGYSPARAFVIFRKAFGTDPDRLTAERARARAKGAA